MTENPDHDAAASRRRDEAGDGWHHDHVVVESWFAGRWRWFDPEVDSPRPTQPQLMDPRFLFDEVIHEEAHRFGDELLPDRYRADADLHPGGTVLQMPPYGDPPVEVELRPGQALVSDPSPMSASS